MAAKAIVNWPLRLTLIGGVAILGLMFSALKEMNPINGTWVVHQATEGGKPIPEAKSWRIFLDIEGGHATIASYWTCGVRRNTFAEGVIVRKGDRMELYKRIRMTSDLEETSNGHFDLLPNREIGYDFPGSGGEPIHLVFRRESNTPTLLDIFGWH